MSTDQFNPKTGRWEPAVPLPEPRIWKLWRFLRLMPRDPGPKEAEEAVAFLRDLSTRTTLTDAETDALRILRQREITESVRRRQAAWRKGKRWR